LVSLFMPVQGIPFHCFWLCTILSTAYYSVSPRVGVTSKEDDMSKARGFLQEFQEFAVRGNMIDLAVGVIIGAAFSKIIDSLVKDIIMPIVSFILGGEVDFTNKFWILRMPENYSGPETYDAFSKAGAVLLSWGNFITILINF